MKQPKFFRRFDYNKTLLPNSHLAELEQNVESIEQARETTGLTIGYPGWNLMYYMLLSHLKPEHGNLINFEFVSWYTPGLAIWQKEPFPTIDIQ